MSNEDNGVTPSAPGASAAASQRSGRVHHIGCPQCDTAGQAFGWVEGRGLFMQCGKCRHQIGPFVDWVRAANQWRKQIDRANRRLLILDEPRGLSAAEGASPERVIPNPVDPTPGERGE